MSKKMLFNMNEPEEIRATIIEDGQLVEFDVEARTREKNRNNIYRGYIVQIEPSLQAAFVEYGANRHGFLPFGEIHPNFYSQPAPPGEENPNVAPLLRKGQSVLVQVVREEMGNKGAALTTYCTLPGRYIVLMPLSGNSGISRKIEDQSERRAIRDMMKELRTRDGVGYIVRTAGMGMTQEDLKRDYEILSRLWDNIKQAARRGPRVGLIFEDGDLLQRMIRDYYDDSVTEILVDEAEAFERAYTYFAAVMPQHENVVKHYDDKLPLFIKYNIEPQLAQIYQRKIPLPSGGSIVIDATEALVAIDVNSGKTQSDNTEETAYKTNVEAAGEVARQLRLRDLGGLVVIDFIGMRLARHNRGVERAIRQAIKDDKARVKVGRISSFFGLLTLSRQRIRDAKGFSYFSECPSCAGTGRLPNAESSALLVLRHLQGIAHQDQYERIQISLPTEVALRLLNEKRHRLTEMEAEYDIAIELQPREGLAIDLEEDITLVPRRSESKRQQGRQPVQMPVEQRVTPTAPAPALTPAIATPSPTAPSAGRERVVRLEEPQVEKRPTRPQQPQEEIQPPRVSAAPTGVPSVPVAPEEPSRPLSMMKETSMPAGLPWFLSELAPRQDAPPPEDVVAWAMTQPNQPPVSLPKRMQKPSSQRVVTNGETQRQARSVNGEETPAESRQHPRRRPERPRRGRPPRHAAPAQERHAASMQERPTTPKQERPATPMQERPAAVSKEASGVPITAHSTRRRIRRGDGPEPHPPAPPVRPPLPSDEAAPPKTVAPKSAATSSTRRAWSDEELILVKTLRHLPLAEAHRQFKAKGYNRSPNAFRQKYYSLRP